MYHAQTAFGPRTSAACLLCWVSKGSEGFATIYLLVDAFHRKDVPRGVERVFTLLPHLLDLLITLRNPYFRVRVWAVPRGRARCLRSDNLLSHCVVGLELCGIRVAVPIKCWQVRARPLPQRSLGHVLVDSRSDAYIRDHGQLRVPTLQV